MTVTNVEKDAAALTMTITADLDAPVARAWQLWEDPRQLERWWGPPMYPATFLEHDLAPGACSRSMRRTTSSLRTGSPTILVARTRTCRR